MKKKKEIETKVSNDFHIDHKKMATRKAPDMAHKIMEYIKWEHQFQMMTMALPQTSYEDMIDNIWHMCKKVREEQ